jgi:hypothetical protein
VAAERNSARKMPQSNRQVQLSALQHYCRFDFAMSQPLAQEWPDAQGFAN